MASDRVAIATNSGGCLRGGAWPYGTTRDFILGMELVLGDGHLLKLGSDVRKDVTGYDLVRLLVGSEGTLGVVVEATLRLVERPESESSVLAAFSDQLAGAGAALRVR